MQSGDLISLMFVYISQEISKSFPWLAGSQENKTALEVYWKTKKSLSKILARSLSGNSKTTVQSIKNRYLFMFLTISICALGTT